MLLLLLSYLSKAYKKLFVFFTRGFPYSFQENGHKHNVEPHSHSFSPANPRMPIFVASPSCDSYFTGLLHNGHDGREDLSSSYWCMDEAWSTQPGSGDTEYTTATIKSAHADLGGVDQSKDGVDADAETRPKNMKLVFIIRIE